MVCPWGWGVSPYWGLFYLLWDLEYHRFFFSVALDLPFTKFPKVCLFSNWCLTGWVWNGTRKGNLFGYLDGVSWDLINRPVEYYTIYTPDSLFCTMLSMTEDWISWATSTGCPQATGWAANGEPWQEQEREKWSQGMCSSGSLLKELPQANCVPWQKITSQQDSVSACSWRCHSSLGLEETGHLLFYVGTWLFLPDSLHCVHNFVITLFWKWTLLELW